MSSQKLPMQIRKNFFFYITYLRNLRDHNPWVIQFLWKTLDLSFCTYAQHYVPLMDMHELHRDFKAPVSMLVFMCLLNKNHAPPKKDTTCSILFSSRNKSLSQNYALYCILFIYIAFLIWEIFCKSDNFSTTNMYLAQVLQMNTLYFIENIFHTIWHAP